ncbi:MAG: methyltransferase [Pseudomonadota bacterium]
MTGAQAPQAARRGASAGPTLDRFLGGRLSLWQPSMGYRAGIDAVLLAAACPAARGQSVLELGCGVGTAALCLGTRIPGLRMLGVERRPDMVRFARCNAARTGLALRVVTADLAALPPALRQMRFDHVIANPPYFRREGGGASPDALRESAMGEDTPLDAWIDTAARRLSPKGTLTLVHRAERLGGLLTALEPRLGSIEVLPLSPRQGRAARLLLVRARKAGRAPLILHAPRILHAGATHEQDADDYTPEISAVLRAGKSLLGFTR